MVDARLFQALSDPTRLKILLMLSNSPMNVSSMVDQLKCAQPAVSRHLRVLREAAVIRDMRKGKEVEYSLNHDKLRDARLYLEALGGRGAEPWDEKGETRGKEVDMDVTPGATQSASVKVAESRGGKTGRHRSRSAAKRGPGIVGRESGPVKPKSTSRVSSEEMPDFVVEREEDAGMDDFLL